MHSNFAIWIQKKKKNSSTGIIYLMVLDIKHNVEEITYTPYN